MIESKLWARLSVALAVAIAFTPLQAAVGNNGVYFEVDSNIWYDVDVEPLIRYSCHGGGASQEIDAASPPVYCKTGADVDVHWLPRAKPGGATITAELGTDEYTLDGNNRDHCGPGQAPIWFIASNIPDPFLMGMSGSTISQKSNCNSPPN